MRAPSSDDVLQAFLDMFGLTTKEQLTPLGLSLLGHAWIDQWLIHLLATRECIEEIRAGRVAEADIDAALDALIAKHAEGTFYCHLKLAQDQRLLDPEIIEICEEVNRGRDHFLHWKPGRFQVPQYRGAEVTSTEGFEVCMKDVAHAVRTIKAWQP